jgi:hypothetical protein
LAVRQDGAISHPVLEEQNPAATRRRTDFLRECHAALFQLRLRRVNRVHAQRHMTESGQLVVAKVLLCGRAVGGINLEPASFLSSASHWCQRDYQSTDAFLILVHNSFGAEALPGDFVHSPQAAAAGIYGWVERRTNRKINAAVTPGQFIYLTRPVLCDAIYFKGKWQHQFKASDTNPLPSTSARMRL